MFAVVLLIGIAITVIELLLPKALQIVIDNVLPEKDTALLFWIMLTLVVLIIVSTGLTLQRNVRNRKLQELVAMNVQLYIYRKIKSMGFSYFEEHPVGESIGLLQSEVDALQRYYRETFPRLIQCGLFSFICLVLICTISVPMALMMFPALIVYSIFGSKIIRCLPPVRHSQIKEFN
ncbi:ABC transporter transmembrane domain-containing protein [Paenibacillus xylaniclasticus]|uniref:ABC transporter transmembrane domain-containing protein n=1 Tax=Paenibacillus xylaniclasticus TaxID=588083 RepID=UPI000FD8FC49|nr:MULTISPECIES: ABC transporter transmembrane domain-containing protein [Paenibacillus]GFN30449.1 hypothetical protein PCURB6_07090 [Paenibacillus curdlanolyticus]